MTNEQLISGLLGVGVIRGFHGSPVSNITQFDRLAPRDIASKADRIDSVGTWIAQKRSDANVFTGGAKGRVYELEHPASNPRVYSSWKDLISEFNQVARGRPPAKGEPVGMAPNGGNLFRDYLKSKGFDSIKVTDKIDADKVQEYWAVLDPELIKILR